MTNSKRTARAPLYARLATLAALLALAGTTAPVSSAQKQPTQYGIENFGKVNDNYYRGAQPRGEDFAELKRLGVKTVVDLRKDSAARVARPRGPRRSRCPYAGRRWF